MQKKYVNWKGSLLACCLLAFMVLLMNISCRPVKETAASIPLSSSSRNDTMQFIISREQLMAAYNEKWPQKIIFEVEVDFTRPDILILHAYVARNHRNYARGGRDTLNIETIVKGKFPPKFIAGNSEVDLKPLLFFSNGKNITYTDLIIRPGLDPTGRYIIFKLYSVEKTLSRVMENYLREAIPCPPGKPSDGD
jgi:hypothetical protein